MQGNSGTVVGIFSDITAARRTIDELHGKGIVAARLVENDQAVTFTGTAERDAGSGSEPGVGEYHRSHGVRGFLARLFGYDHDRADWNLNSDTETYFRNAYDKNSHLIIIEDCREPGLCRDVISRMGGVVEEQGSDYFHRERGSAAASGMSQTERADRPRDFDESLDSSRRSAVDHAADSGIGVDVDRMPFAHTIPPHEMTVSDRISQSRLSGTADHIPFAAQRTDEESRMERGDRGLTEDRASAERVTADADRMPFAGQSSETIVADAGGTASSRDSSFGTGVAEPSGPSFADDQTDDDLLVSAERLAFVDRPAQDDRAAGTVQLNASPGAGVPSDANSMPFAGSSLDTGARAEPDAGRMPVTDRRATAGATANSGTSLSEQGSLKGDRALDGISGDADRTPLVGQLSHRDNPVRAGGGSSGDPVIDSILSGDDRIHDRGVSNADVARLSSDRMMETEDKDQHLVDEDIEELNPDRRRAGLQDRSSDNGHILPDHSFPPPPTNPPAHPGA
jgi:hypothetical protein